MINYIKGDLFKSKDDVLVHGCNCFCTMGGGVAKFIKQYYPLAYMADCKTRPSDKDKLGSYTFVELKHYFYPERMITIVNAYTQYDFYGKDDLFEYDAFRTVLKKIKKEFSENSICMPKIGAGLAGGDWNRIEQIINEEFPDKQINIYYL